MAEIETLTEEDRSWLKGTFPKALRIIDAQAARIAKLEALLSESRSWLQTHDERGVLRELDELCERVDGMLSP